MEGFEYETRIEDGMSGPAREEIRALKDLAGQIAITEKQLRKFQEANREHTEGSVLGETAKEFAIATTAAGLLTRGIESVIEGAMKAGEALADLGVESTKFAIEAAEFRENTVLAYAAVQGTAEEGEATFKQLDRIAGSFHMPAKQAHQLARDLMLQGLEDTKLIGSTIEAQAALMRTGQIAGAAKLQSIIEKSLASGHFDAGKGLAGGKGGGAASGRALAGLGVHLPELLADIAKRTGQSIGQVQAQLKQGKIGVETGVAALVDAINTGVIGKAAAAKYDIRDFTTDATNFFARMVQDIDLKPIEEGLLGVSSVLGFVAGRKEGVQGVFQTIVDWSGHAIEAATNLGLDLYIMFLKSELAAMPLIRAFERVVDEIKSVIHWAEQAGNAIIEFEKKIPGVGGLISKAQDVGKQEHHKVDAWDLLPGIGGIIEAARISTGNSAKDMGISLEPNDKSAEKAGIDMGKQAVAGARIGADAHSPSDEMKDLGRDMSDGLGIGFSPKNITESMRDGSGDAGSGGGHTFNFSMGDIHAGHGADASELASLVMSKVEDAYSRFALELGR